MQWLLQPVDARRSKLTVRLSMPTPPTLTAAQPLALLRAKAAVDLADFSRNALAP